MPGPSGLRGGFRTDIEGLRAVAALLVAIYHIWLGRVSGGVDVFFVIAGFLITGTLVRQIQRTGTVHPGRFLGRLLVRLLPNALTVLVVVLTATLVLLPTTRRGDILREIAASALYVENWALISASVDYLARDRGDSPVQHFWALSIQGQFYLIWLGMALLALAVGVRRLTHRRLAVLISLVTVASFVFSVVLTQLDQPVAYFHTGARAWEFGVGGLVALGVLRAPRVGARGQLLLGWGGLGLIVGTGLVLPVASTFPGLAALVPVAGAVLILLSTGRGRGSAAAFLSSRPLVSLGGVAYAIYLWHWPLLVFTLHLRGVDQAGAVDGLLVIALAVALAYASTHLVEKPVRGISWDLRGGWSAPASGALASVLVVGLTGAVNAASVPTMPVSAHATLTHWADPRSAPDFDAPASDTPSPGFLAADGDLPQVALDDCQRPLRSPHLGHCTYGVPDAERTMVIVGGSQSAHWQPALEEIAQQTGWRLVVAVKSGCRQGLHLVGPEHGLYADETIDDSCRKWNEQLLEMLLTERPDLVVGNTTVVTLEEETLPAYYDAFWRELQKHDIPMLGIRGTPRTQVHRLECIEAHGADHPACSSERSQAFAGTNPAAALAEELPGLTVVDLTDWLCSEETCPPVIEDTIVYHDGYHLTATFVRALAHPLFRAAPEVFAER